MGDTGSLAPCFWGRYIVSISSISLRLCGFGGQKEEIYVSSCLSVAQIGQAMRFSSPIGREMESVFLLFLLDNQNYIQTRTCQGVCSQIEIFR